MPLIKSSSDDAFKSNLKAEIGAGKPQKQALAIAYSVKRQNRADGGEISDQQSGGLLGGAGVAAFQSNDNGEGADSYQAAFDRNKGWAKSGNYRTDLGNQEPEFRQWVQNNNVPFDVNRTGPDDYDMRGFWQGAQTGDPRANTSPNPNDGQIHYDDKWKTPYHKSFSSESQWAQPNAPTWNEKDQLIDPSNGSVVYDERAHQSNVGQMANGGSVNPALNVAYSVKRANRAAGGPPPAPWQVRSEARNMTHSGPIMSAVAGRTDHHPMNVAAGSYVLPADHVSSLGQGNTQSGMSALGHMFGSSGPYGIGKDMGIKHGSGAPAAPKAPKLAQGGVPKDHGQPVPINAAGGEFVIPPETVARIGGGDIKRGHAILDNWVVANRKKHVKTLQKLPGPAKS